MATARVHPLSTYTPLCGSCGLALCSLHRPHFVCPSCDIPLLTVSKRSGLIQDLDKQIEETLKKEDEERLREAEQARARAGEFPSLPGASQSAAPQSIMNPGSTNPQPKILTLSYGKNKSKNPTVTNFHSAPRAAVHPSSSRASPTLADDMQEDGMRVPRPPVDVTVYSVDPNRPWANLRAMTGGSSGPVYVGRSSGR